MIVIIDYGMGNLRSVQKAFQRLNCPVLISRDINEIEKADKLVLPGVGHFAKGMNNLNEYNLINILNYKVNQAKTPVLGICLGMQLMTSFSEEGNINGLNWIDARTVRFNFSNLPDQSICKIPHMGWNNITVAKHNLFSSITDSDFFYFVHSYYVKCNNDNDVLFRTNYNIDFDSGFIKDNIIGVQFHPEKSHSSGLKLLKNFISG
jgi:imidazole glycerol-phosphate synthase subunit HisH